MAALPRDANGDPDLEGVGMPIIRAIGGERAVFGLLNRAQRQEAMARVREAASAAPAAPAAEAPAPSQRTPAEIEDEYYDVVTRITPERAGRPAAERQAQQALVDRAVRLQDEYAAASGEDYVDARDRLSANGAA